MHTTFPELLLTEEKLWLTRMMEGLTKTPINLELRQSLNKTLTLFLNNW
jgi:hypothetical protein